MVVLNIPSEVYLYDGGKSKSLKLNEISRYIKKTFKNFKVKIREEFINFYLSKLPIEKRKEVVKILGERFASIKVYKIGSRDLRREPLPGEIEYEIRRLLDKKSKSSGILYDGFKLEEILSEFIPKDELNFKFCHIVFTNQLFGTWDENDKRWHARVSIYGFPSIISTTGIVEAPAKPKEFYLKKQMGINIEILKKEFEGRFIDYDDYRLTEVMKGYVMQSIFFHITGEPFCSNKKCRLFNAHWQEEVINSQLKKGDEFCKKHQEIIKMINS